MKSISAFTYLICIIGIGLGVFFTGVLKPSSTNAYIIFSIWLSTPGLALIFLNRWHASLFSNPIGFLTQSIIVIGGGIYFLADIIYIHSDAQGAIGVLIVPILQLVAIALTIPLIKFGLKKM